MFVTPELEVSDYYPNWAAPDAPWAVPGLFSWAYLRMGVEASVGPISVAASTALRSTPFGGPFGLSAPIPIGLEFRWHAAETPLVISAMAIGEVESASAYWFGGGLTIGLRI